MPFTLPALPWRLIGALVYAVALIWGVLAYGNARYDKGVSDTDAAWKAASERLAKQSLEASGVAGEAADKRAEAHAERLEKEKEKIDAAVADGRDPFDVMFPAGGV